MSKSNAKKSTESGRRHDDDFNRAAVNLVVVQGYSIPAAAVALGVSAAATMAAVRSREISISSWPIPSWSINGSGLAAQKTTASWNEPTELCEKRWRTLRWRPDIKRRTATHGSPSTTTKHDGRVLNGVIAARLLGERGGEL